MQTRTLGLETNKSEIDFLVFVYLMKIVIHKFYNKIIYNATIQT